jgi:S-phase kinase-associated protein 1
MAMSIAVKKKVRGGSGKISCQVKTKGGKMFDLEESIVLLIPKIAQLLPGGKHCILRMCQTGIETGVCPANICISAKKSNPKDLPETNPNIPTLTVIQENPLIINLARTRGDTFALMLRWLRHHVRDPRMEQFLTDHTTKKLVPPWDKKFFEKVGRDAIFAMLQNASAFDIHYMQDLLCQTVADQLKGKTAEQIRDTFGIVSDFSPEEEAKIKEDNARIMRRVKALTGQESDNEDPEEYWNKKRTSEEEEAFEKAVLPHLRSLGFYD